MRCSDSFMHATVEFVVQPMETAFSKNVVIAVHIALVTLRVRFANLLQAVHESLPVIDANDGARRACNLSDPLHNGGGCAERSAHGHSAWRIRSESEDAWIAVDEWERQRIAVAVCQVSTWRGSLPT